MCGVNLALTRKAYFSSTVNREKVPAGYGDEESTAAPEQGLASPTQLDHIVLCAAKRGKCHFTGKQQVYTPCAIYIPQRRAGVRTGASQ